MHITVLTVHIIAGAFALLFGYVALYAAKGAKLHRASGTLFVYTMVTMAMLGATIAGVWGPAASINIPAGLLTTYLVITGLNTVAAQRRGSAWLDIGLMLVALAVGLAMLSRGVEVIAHGKNKGFVFPFVMFATIALLGSAGDLRVLLSGARTGAPRLARHLWRMNAALLIAVLSFSVRLPRILPRPLRTPVVYALPMLVVLVTMFYWLWRVRSRRSSRGIVVTAQSGRLAIEAA